MSEILCLTCKHKEYCPREPKTVIACERYKKDTAIVSNIQTDLFEEPHIQIKDNPILEKAVNRLLLMIQRDSTLLDGDSMAEIDRTIYANVLLEDGAQKMILPDKREEFIKLIIKSQDGEIYGRARRYILEHDLKRVKASAVKSAEQFRSRIASGMRK
jgi:hypothetical protein